MPSRHVNRGAFGDDTFGRLAEQSARFLGTPQYIVAQTIIVAIWIVLNSIAVAFRWDPYPFILLNLAFSTQAAYAAPLILLAETRQAERDKSQADEVDRRHTELERAAAERTAAIKTETDRLVQLIETNTRLTEEDKALTEEVHRLTTEIQRLLSSRAS